MLNFNTTDPKEKRITDELRRLANEINQAKWTMQPSAKLKQQFASKSSEYKRFLRSKGRYI